MWEEARALAAFRHPSLPIVYTFGTHKGVDYLVMERIYGVSLKADLDRRRESGEMLTLTEALELVIAVAEGLAVVHRAGLAHRDVKPSNVMLTPDRRVVLMDFGLVLPEFAMSSRPAAAGSPPYMAPEALTNRVEAGQGHLVDVYSLGALAFELLVGRPPRTGPTLHEVLQEHVHERIPSVGRLCGGLPERLSMLIDEMLASDPETRPQSAEGIVWQLKSIQERDVKVRKRGPSDVLVVEDNKGIARVLEFYVEQELGNAEVRVATDGEEALRAIREQEPDVLLLDLHLPQMNGIELCMYMRGEGIGRECTIIPVTAGAEEHDRQLLHQLGIHHFVRKTAGLKEELTRTLRQVAGLSGATEGSAPASQRS